MRAGSLDTYQRMRDFRRTPEPRGKRETAGGALRFVIQKHAARRLHYDFRLEWDGVFRSWAIPKGPSLDPGEKRMAVEVEDHPLSYGSFEGEIPAGQYGAGSVEIWDRGRWKPSGDAARGLREGKLKFTLEGEKLQGGFTLVRMRPRGNETKASWLLIKEKDSAARAAYDFAVVEQRSESIVKPRRGRSVMPLLLAPQLATLVDAPPQGGEWRYELKLDGYRLLTRVDRKGVRCFTRSGQDWSAKLPQIVAAVRALKLPPCWLDGEIVVLDEEGVPDFQNLQNAFEGGRTAGIRYFLFDLPFHDGHDLRDTPLVQRRAQLRTLLAGGKQDRVRLSATLEGDPRQLLEAARAAGFEGLIGKRADAHYSSGRNRDWIKLKTGLRQEFVIGGFTDPQGSRTGLGALLLGVHDAAGKLRYTGNVGTGFDQKTLGALRAKLEAIETTKSPFEGGPEKVGTVKRVVPHWTRPKLVAEIAFAGWTGNGSVRQGVFHGLRDDKPPRQIVRETPHAASTSDTIPVARKRKVTLQRTAAATHTGLSITHPDRVIDRTTGITKGELVAYYAAVESLLKPHLADRPVSLLRAPDGVAGGKFFQKHAEARAMPHLKRLPRSLDPGNAALLVIPSKLALLSAAQMNVIELHTWNATASQINKPDRMVFDLDPGDGVAWSVVRESAQLLHALLNELKLRSFLKTSGGKGLHVVVPLKPELGWDPVKAFSKRVVEHLARTLPQRFVAKSGPRNRIGKVFVDYLRNGRGATTACAWSARAREGMGISVPVDWDELPELQAMQWSVSNYEDRLSVGNAPWKQYERARQTLAAALRALD